MTAKQPAEEALAGPAPARAVLLALLIVMAALGPLGMHVFLPSMPGMTAVFDTDYGMVQLTLTLYFAAFAVAQLIYGPLSDRYGRRPVVLIGIALSVLGTTACMFAPTIEALIAGRILQAVGACAGMSLGRAIIRDLYDREQAASMLAYVTMAMVLAPMAAPIIGGYLDVWYGWRASFLFVLIVSIMVVAAAVLWLQETHLDRHTVTGFASMIGSYRRLLRHPAFRAYAFQTSFTSGAFFGFLGGAPFVFITLMERPANEYGWYFMAMAGCYMLGNYTAGRLTPRVGSDRMIRIGTGISLFSTLSLGAVYLAVPLTPLGLFIPMSLMSVGHGFSMPNGNAGAVSVDPTRAGAAAGLSGFLQLATGAIASASVGALLTETAAPLVIMLIFCATLAFFFHAWGMRGRNTR